MSKRGVVVVGAGIGGLSAAIELAVEGHAVTVIEQAHRVGGKMRTVEIGGHAIDVGPTLADLVLLVAFVRALGPTRVRWRGRLLHIGPDGALEPSAGERQADVRHPTKSHYGPPA